MIPGKSIEPVQSLHSAAAKPHDGHTTLVTVKSGRLLRLPAVMDRCALGRSSIYAGVKNGTFVTPVRLSTRAVGWREDEIDSWVAERVKTGAPA